MMPVVVAPVVMMPRTMAADFARAVLGPDDPAVAVRVIIGRRVAIARTEVVPVREPISAVAIAATAENMRGAKPAATEHGAAAS